MQGSQRNLSSVFSGSDRTDGGEIQEQFSWQLELFMKTLIDYISKVTHVLYFIQFDRVRKLMMKSKENSKYKGKVTPRESL